MKGVNMLGGRRRSLRLLAISAIVGMGVAFAAPATGVGAQGPFPVVASNLDNPRGLAFGADGALYVAEGGTGGNGTCVKGPEGDDVCYGTTGAITRIQGGKQERIATGLPSLAAKDGSGATGATDVSL